MKAVTIDNLDMKDHLRWAQDQQVLDSAFATESTSVAPHSEIQGMSMIYPSKFDELFELQKRNQHWACFSSPNDFHLFRKRFFSYRLFPTIDWEENEDAEEEEDLDLIHAVNRIKTLGSQGSTLLEKDKGAMLSLLESIKWLNSLLKQINARKLQFQKG